MSIPTIISSLTVPTIANMNVTASAPIPPGMKEGPTDRIGDKSGLHFKDLSNAVFKVPTGILVVGAFVMVFVVVSIFYAYLLARRDAKAKRKAPDVGAQSPADQDTDRENGADVEAQDLSDRDVEAQIPANQRAESKTPFLQNLLGNLSFWKKDEDPARMRALTLPPSALPLPRYPPEERQVVTTDDDVQGELSHVSEAVLPSPANTDGEAPREDLSFIPEVMLPLPALPVPRNPYAVEGRQLVSTEENDEYFRPWH